MKRQLALAALFLAAWILPPFWGIATLQTVNVQDDIFVSDLWNDRVPARAFVGASWWRGDPPVWMPGIYTGFPTLAQVEVGALYPSNVVLFGLFPPHVALAWAQILPLAIAGLGMFLLASEMALPLAARLLSAGAFSLCGFLIVHFRQLNMVDAAAWLPLLFYLVERIAKRSPGRAPLALATVWTLELLAGHSQITYYGGLFLGAYLVARRWQLRSTIPLRELPRDAIVAFGLPIVLGTLVTAVQLLPASELARSTYREGGLRFEAATQYAVSPLSFTTFFLPTLFGDARDRSFVLSGLFWEQYGYLGLLTAILAIVAVIVRRGDPHVRLLAVTSIVAYLLALGRNTPLFHLAFVAVPGMAYFRFPARFVVFTEIGVALLAGFGLAAVLEAVPSRFRRAAAAIVLAVVAGDLWFHQTRQIPQVETRRWLEPFGTEQRLTAARRSSPEPWRYYTLNPDIVHRELYHRGGAYGGDLSSFVQLRALLQPSFNLLYGLESPDGYSNLVPRHYEAVWGSEKKRGITTTRHLETGELEPELANVLRLFNVRFVLSPVPMRSPSLQPVEQTAEGMHIYELHDWLPRAFVVGQLVREASEEQAVGRLLSPRFEPERQAIVEAEVVLPPEAGSSSQVEITRRSNTEVVLRASLPKPGLLVLSEGYYPGWRASVDGEDAPIHRVNVMMRGVVLPAGDHDVVFRFRSATIRAGLVVSLVALAALFLTRRVLTIRATPA